MANLPGQNKDNPPLPPNVGPQNASIETVKAVAHWNAQVEFKEIPPDLDKLLRQHAEYLAWAQGSIVGSFRFTQ